MKHNSVQPSDIIDDQILIHPTNVDVWIVLAKVSSTTQDRQLVTMRTRSNLSSLKWNDNKTVEKLYNDLSQQLKTDGLDAKRVGGV